MRDRKQLGSAYTFDEGGYYSCYMCFHFFKVERQGMSGRRFYCGHNQWETTQGQREGDIVQREGRTMRLIGEFDATPKWCPLALEVDEG